jgi:hypothetical protein
LEEDWAFFDTHAYVLRGINEQVLRLNQVLSILALHGDALEVRIFMDLPAKNARMELSLKEAMDLAMREPWVSGSFGLRVTKRRSLDSPNSSKMSDGGFRPARLLEAVAQGSDDLFQFVDDLVSEEHVGIDLLDTRQNRWLQLNGWRKLIPDHPDLRLAYERGRLFLPRNESDQEFLIVEWMVPDCPFSTDCEVEVSTNGVRLRRSITKRGIWNVWSIRLDAQILQGRHFCAEICLIAVASKDGVALQPERHIAVRRFLVSRQGSQETSSLSVEPSLGALLEANDSCEAPFLLCGPDVDSAMLVLREIRRLTRKSSLSIVVGSPQKSFFAAVPWLNIEACYEGVGPPVDMILSRGKKRVLVLGFRRDADILKSLCPNESQSVWWIDPQCCPVNVESLTLPTLRETLGRLLLDAATVQCRQLTQDLLATQAKLQETLTHLPQLSGDTGVPKTKLRETQAKLTKEREKVLKLKAKVAELKKRSGESRRGWFSRLIRKFRGE